MPKGIKGFQKGHKLFGGIQFKKGHKIRLGQKQSKKTKEKIRQKQKGRHYSPETEFKKKDICIYDKVGGKYKYRRLHIWVEKKLGKPTKCENCGKDGLTGRKIHWANISGEYKKDVNDWIRLCVRCHFYKDKKSI